MSSNIFYIDRITKEKEEEQVYGQQAIFLMYGSYFLSRYLQKILRFIVAYFPIYSFIYGFFQKTIFSKKKISPFIKKFQVDESEFLDPVESFGSFNDFFCRKLKPCARPIDPNKESAIIPADGRFLFYQDFSKVEKIFAKGKVFSLESFLQDKELAKKYHNGSCVIGRLCPTDYHRFHFPFDGEVIGVPHLINGWLHSVNPLALTKNIHFISENKRIITTIHSEQFGTILYVEVGATSVGSIHQTFSSNKEVAKKITKGEEKGFFSFGGSMVVLLFEPKKMLLNSDLINYTKAGYEVKCLMGQSMGTVFNKK